MMLRMPSLSTYMLRDVDGVFQGVDGYRLVDESFLVEEESLDGHVAQDGAVVNTDHIDS
jgi:hypothetical protein